ncbi:MAG: phosphopantothenate---cysteine ligase [Planctomycetota bacterium]|nr:phosphopantothenate---cysteine ligase [Planctomycetota bacterium]
MGSLVGKHVMITSGPTRGYIDAVRYISNTSTGKLGAMIATELLKSGACVTFIYGIGSRIPDIALLDKDCARRLMLIEVETIDDLATTTQEKLKDNSFDAIVHAMAVIDYTPEARSNGKIPSNKDTLVVTFVRAPKILKLIRKLWPRAFLISFKLEVGLSRDKLVERAYTSLIENSADLVVANNQGEIAGNKHQAYLVNSQKNIESCCETKQDIAKELVTAISKHLKPINQPHKKCFPDIG